MKKIKGISKFFYAVFITIDVILLVAAAVILITTLVFGGGGSDTSVFGHNIILVDTDEFPLFKKGSAVITEEISAGELKEKNIVIFKNENGAPAIGEILSAQEEITALSRGETITLSADRIIGKAVYYSEILGGIISFAVSPAGVCTIAILPCLAFVLFQLAAASRAKMAEEDKEDYRGFGSERKKSAEKDDNVPVKKSKKDEISQKHASTGVKKAEEEKEDHRGSELKKSAEKGDNAPAKKSKKAPKEEDNGGEKITDYKIKTAEFKAAGTAEEKAEEKAAAAKAAEEARLEAERRAAERAERIAAEKAKAERLAAERAEAERREREKTSAVEKQKLYEAAGLFNPMMKKRSSETAVIKKDNEEKAVPVLVSEGKKAEVPEVKEEVRTYEPKKEEKDAKTGEERLDSLFTEEDDSDSDYDIDEILRSIEEKRKNK